MQSDAVFCLFLSSCKADFDKQQMKQLSLPSVSLTSCTAHHATREIHTNLTEPPQHTDGLSCSKTEEFSFLFFLFGGVQTATRSQRLHSTAQKRSTFNAAADVEGRRLARSAPRSKLSEEEGGGGGGGDYIPCCKQVKRLLPPLSGEEKYSSVILDVTKISQLGAIMGYPAGILQRMKQNERDDDEQLLVPYHCDIRVQYESNFSATRIH